MRTIKLALVVEGLQSIKADLVRRKYALSACRGKLISTYSYFSTALPRHGTRHQRSGRSESPTGVNGHQRLLERSPTQKGDTGIHILHPTKLHIAKSASPNSALNSNTASGPAVQLPSLSRASPAHRDGALVQTPSR